MTTPRSGRKTVLRRLSGLVFASLIGLGALATPAAAAERYRIDLGSRNDYVAQTNFVQCVGASMQMMLNMIKPGTDRSARTQLRLQKLAREYSGPRMCGRPRKGASVRGWVAGLNLNGGGPYRLVGTSSLNQAMRVAAIAIETTGRPVGLLVWRGRHAWVMSGFEATKSPTAGGRVTRAIIEDPLYPYGSKLWGPSPRPGEAITVREVGRQFVPRGHNTWSGTFEGMYVLVVPYEREAPDQRFL